MDMWVRAELKRQAKQSVKRCYWSAVIVCIIFLALQAAAGSTSEDLVDVNITYNVNGDESGNSSQVQSYLDGTSNTLEGYLENYIARATGIGAISSVLTSTVLFYGILLMIVRLCLNYLIVNPIQVGMASFFYRNRTEKTSIGELAFAFNRQDFLPVVKTMFLRGLYIALWTLLLIIPGIVKSYEYRMVDYILSEHPDMPTKEVLQLSKAMTKGHKWKMFVLDLSFFGWALLGALSWGIVDIFWTNPYRQATEAELYAALKAPFTAEEAQADVF
jgi:uncharacterized membrane protein